MTMPKQRPMHPDLKAGSRWRDNDPRRNPPRTVEVMQVFPSGQVRIRTVGSSRETLTKATRFGRRARSGYTLVERAPNPLFGRSP